MDTEKQRQRRRNNERLTKSGNARSKQLLEMPTLLWRIAASRSLEWIGTSKTQLVFRYEISDLFSRPCHKRKTNLVWRCNTLCPFLLCPHFRDATSNGLPTTFMDPFGMFGPGRLGPHGAISGRVSVLVNLRIQYTHSDLD